jgi:transcriptional regulator with XRE-family HTH domain
VNRIKEVLKQQGRSQVWLAEKLGMSYLAVTRYCNNIRQPNLDVLNRIAEILGVDNRDLLVPLKNRDGKDG